MDSFLEKDPSLQEIAQLAAIDSPFYCKTFFPQTFRQAIPAFHHRIWDLLDDPSKRYVNIQVFRDGAKTSILRAYSSKRIAYGISRTVLSIGKSEEHAVRSVKWLKHNVEHNQRWTATYGLKKGSKWSDTEIEIIHATLQHAITVIALGVTGSTRGVNVDDYRPDLILGDDILDEENTATPEQRKKISELFYGAIKESLAPQSESPDAKLVFLQTPLNRDDPSTLALNDPQWASARFGCWTPETENLPIDYQVSAWEERYATEVLRNEKLAAITRNQLSIWTREKECKLINPETSAFKSEWLQYYDEIPLCSVVIMAIDPVPPPSATQVAQNFQKKDFEALVILGLFRGNYYLLDYALNRGHDPSWTIAKFFELAIRFRPRETIVESVAYQRTLGWILRQAMIQRSQFFTIVEQDDKRSKYDKIVDGLNGISSNQRLYVRREHHEFISQFTDYPQVSNDDLIEAVAVALNHLSGHNIIEGEYEALLEEEKDLEPLKYNVEALAP